MIRRILLGLLALPFVLVALLAGLLETRFGQSTLRGVVERASGITIAGLDGSPLRATTLTGIELRDADGAWLRIGRVELSWSVTRLLARQVDVTHLRVADLDLLRLPAGEDAAPEEATEEAGGDFSLPVSVVLRELTVANARIAEPIAGTELRLDAHGKAAIARDLRGTAELTAEAAGGGRYALALTRTDILALKAGITEPENGIIARIAGLPALGALSLDATAEGAPQRAALRAELGFAGGVRATATGTLALEGIGNDLNIAAEVQKTALAAVLPPDMALDALTARLRLRGALAQPQAEGRIDATALRAAGAAVAATSIDLATRPDGTGLRLTAEATATGIAPPPDLPLPPLGDAPLTLSLEALHAADGVITLDHARLAHPLLDATASGRIAAAAIELAVALNLPDIGPFAAASGMEAAGALALAGTVSQAGTRSGGEATLHLTDAVLPAPLGDLLGGSPVVVARGFLDGDTIRVERFTLDGQAVTAEASGSAGAALDLTASVDLPVLAALAPGLGGQAQLSLRASGAMDDPDARLELTAPILSVEGVGEGRLQLTAEGRTLLSAPRVDVQGEGGIGDHPIQVDIHAAPRPDGAIDIKRLLARYGSAEITGQGSVTADQRPDFTLLVKAPDLAALLPGIAGAIEASLRTIPDDQGGVGATLEATGRGLEAGGASVAGLTLNATVADALRTPHLTAEARASTLRSGGITGDLTATAEGTMEQLGLRLGFAGPMLNADLTGGFAAPGTISLESFEARAQGERVRLLSPTTITLGPPIEIAPLAIGVRDGRIDVAGTVGDTLALKLAIRRLPLALAGIAAPDLSLAGTLEADAEIAGTQAAPTGTARMRVRGARMTTGPAASMPAASLDAELRLQPDNAELRATLNAGSALRLRATASARPDLTGPVRAAIDGPVELTLLDPILSPHGRRARGTLRLALRAEGPLPMPALSGTARLSGASIEDGALGLRLNDINGTVRGQGDVLEITNLTGRAGSGTVSVRGTVRPTDPALPVDIDITARNATLTLSDMATLLFAADLKIAGAAATEMNVTGQVAVSRADIRLPDRLPASVVDLPVREVNGTRPQTAPAPAPASAAGEGALRIGLAVALDAPRAVFIRGMGVDAEVGGQLRIEGTADAPDLRGKLSLRRGTISALSQSFTFREGQVDFDGARGIDPSLSLIAATQAGDITALIKLEGSASAPRITLGSEPDMPQDEVLSRMLFGRSQGSLTPFQILGIAQAAAELAGISTPGGGVINQVRSGLGLDRLTMGSDEATGKANVEAGRYLADGVYLGARQGMDGTPQATVQIEVLPNVRIEADVGGEGTGRAGVSWGFDY